MKVTRATLVMMLFLGGCGGCGSCERPENGPGGSPPAPAAASKPVQAPVSTPGTIHASGAEPNEAAKPPTRPPAEPGAAIQPGTVPQAPPEAAPEGGGTQADEDDCIVVADANPDYGPPPLAVTFSAEAECSGGEPKYDWDFGDGTPHGTEANPSHTYAKAGDFTATVSVTGRGDATANDEIDITVEEEEGGGGGGGGGGGEPQ